MVDPGDQAPLVDDLIASNFGAANSQPAAVPGMLGDSYITGTAVQYALGGQTLRALVPYGGRYKCADNTGPIPTNRVSFQYKHYNGALQAQLDDAGTVTSSSGNIDSYILGVEKTFLDNWASLELRIPFYAGSIGIGDPGNESDLVSPKFGNLSFILKVLWSRSDTFALGGGLGIDVPTAGNAHAVLLDNQQTIDYLFREVYIAPFIAFLGTPRDDIWYQGVLQFSFVAGRNQVRSRGIIDSDLAYPEQNLMFLTLNGGKWFYRDPSRSFMQGMAGILELNWTATLNDTAVVTDGALTTIANFANQQNVFNLSAGLHCQLTRLTNLRVAAVVPLRGSNNGDPVAQNRYFDSEVSVQVNRRW